MLFPLVWYTDFKCGCLDVLIKSYCRLSTRFAPFVSADKFFPSLMSCGKILQSASIWNQDLSQESSGGLSSTQRSPATDQPSRRFQTWWCRSKINIEAFTFLSTPEVQHEPVRSSPEDLQLFLHPSEQTVHQMLRSWWRCLDLPRIRSLGRKAEP